jgi:hypothetical protein
MYLINRDVFKESLAGVEIAVFVIKRHAAFIGEKHMPTPPFIGGNETLKWSEKLGHRSSAQCHYKLSS